MMPPTIFYVDDDPTDLEIFSLAAQPLNVDLHLFLDPAKMLWEIEYSAKKPEIIFTDLNMSMLSGMDIIKILRGNHFSTPIVILTNSHNMSNVKSAMDLGANYFITKPAKIASLTNAVKCTLGLDWNNNLSIDDFLHKE
ncbi:MAG TPA: response regulator [Flavobacterium sp.]|jgi:DNA-binding NtrC family response regulator|nr:response regulator [Flavobacterium sp.]